MEKTMFLLLSTRPFYPIKLAGLVQRSTIKRCSYNGVHFDIIEIMINDNSQISVP